VIVVWFSVQTLPYITAEKSLYYAKVVLLFYTQTLLFRVVNLICLTGTVAVEKQV